MSDRNPGLYDDAFLGILQNEGEIMKFLDAVYGFLYRKTDFFIEQNEKIRNMGFPPGIAMKMNSLAFQKYYDIAKRDKGKREKELKEQQKRLSEASPLKKKEENITEVTKATSNSKNEAVVKDTPPSKEQTTAPPDDVKSAQPSTKSSTDCSNKSASEEPNDKSKNKEDPDDDPELTRMQKVYQDNPLSHNGAIRENYSWGQSITDVDAYIKISSNIKRGRDVSVTIERQHLKVCYKGDGGKMVDLVNDKLSWPINREKSLWTLIPGEHIHVNLEKVQERWWESLIESEAKISVRKIDPSRPITDLGDEEQCKIQEMMYNQRQKELGLPQSHEQKTHDMLKSAWDAEGSPFRGQPFDTSSFKFS